MEDKTIKHGPEIENLIPKLKSLPKDDIFQINSETGETQSIHEFLKAGLQVPEGLKDLGMKEEVIALVGNYSSKIFAAAFGGIAIGAPIFPIDPLLKTLELKHLFELSNPKVVFSDKECSSYVIEALDLLKNPANLFVLSDEEPSPVRNSSEQTILIATSSGTTGLPKAVEVTHRTLNFKSGLIMKAPEMSYKIPYLQVTHISWVTGITAMIWPCLSGIKRIYVPHATGTNILNAIHRYKPEWVFMTPIHLISILSHPDFEKCDVSSLKNISVGGSILHQSVADKMKAKWPAPLKLTQKYGVTELIGAVSMPDTKYISSVGLIRMGLELKIVDLETGKSAGSNKLGEVRFRNKYGMMKGYLKKEKETKEAFDETGFYRSGDLGYYNEDGYIFLTGRIKDVIRCKNHQISPVEIEGVILGIPEVGDVAVLGVPHEIDYYHPMALAVKKKNAKLDEKFITDYVADKLSEHKHLFGGVKFIDSVISRNQNGKIKRGKLLELI